jgi:integrase
MKSNGEFASRGTNLLAKNLPEAVIALSETLKEKTSGLAGATVQTANCRGKIVEHAFWMRKEGYAESTISRRIRLLTTLMKRGAILLDPEAVKESIAAQRTWNPKTKELAVEAYTCFLKMLGGTWKPPRYKTTRTLPFIPTEQELNQLIAGSNRKTATFLQLLKETGMRCGEAWMLK